MYSLKKSSDSSFILFSGSSHQDLALEIANVLKVALGKISIQPFPDGEIGVQILENVRGRDVFLLQSAALNPNHYLMELLIMIDAFKRASAKSISVLMPYFPYSRQDRKEKGRVPITARLVADLLEKAGATRVLTMDLHTEQIQGFFNIPVDNLYARPLLVGAIKAAGIENGVIVSPDVGGNRMARKYAEDLKLNLAIIDKRRVDSKKVEFSALIGDVSGKTAILVDDICSTGSTLEIAARVCKERGAKKVVAAVTHGLFTDKNKISGIDQFWTTNSIPRIKNGGEVQSISVAPLFAEAIDCVVSAKSISSLFRREQ